MFFTLGIQTPKKNNNDGYGITVPALCVDGYNCFASADNEADIPMVAREAILLTIQDMLESGKYDIKDIKNDHVLFKNNKAYHDYDMWLIIDVDVSNFSGKQKRINVSLSDILIDRIDNAIKTHDSLYTDRSHFLSESAIKSLSELSSFSGKQKRINITLPHVLIERVDNAINAKNSDYKDRNNFFEEAVISKLSSINRLP